MFRFKRKKNNSQSSPKTSSPGSSPGPRSKGGRSKGSQPRPQAPIVPRPQVSAPRPQAPVNAVPRPVIKISTTPPARPIVDIKTATRMEKAGNEIKKLIDDYKRSGVPMSKEKIAKINEVAIAQNLPLDASILDVLYDHKKHVSAIMPYIEPRLMNFFESKKLVPARGDSLFDVKMLNLCVRVKKDKLTFEDSEVERTEQFVDLDALKYACKLYIWNTKLNKCAIYNTLDENDMKFRYSKMLDRLCSIANVPIRKPAGIDEDKKKDEEQTDGTSSLVKKKKRGDDEDSEDEDSKKDDESDEEKSDEEKSDDEGGEEKSEESKEDEKEEFTENIMEKFTNKDYNFIIGTSLFVLVLFIIYVKYRNN